MSELRDYLFDAANWTGRRGILRYTLAHLQLSATALLIALGVSVPFALFLGRTRRAGKSARLIGDSSVTGANLLRSLPSFAVIVLVLPFSIRYGFGLGFWPTCLALVLLGIPPLFTNTYYGVVGVDQAMVEAGKGVGMTGRQLLLTVELPTALPLILTGLRISATQIVATATLGALVGFEALGTLIVSGLRRGAPGYGQMLTGALCVAVLAIGTELSVGLIERVALPWSRRQP